jgi:hypothetical protein
MNPISGVSKIKMHPFTNKELPTTVLPAFDTLSYHH